MTGDGWRERALCRETGPELFMSDLYAGQALQDVRAVCGRCPARAACLETALAEENGQHHNMRACIRGGLTPRERAVIDRQRRHAA